MKYDSPEYGAYPNEYKDSGYWAAHKLTCEIMAYNTKLLPPSEVPKKWAELTNPKWKGQLGLEGIDSGSQYLMYYIFKKMFGPNYWKQIAENKPKEYDGVGQMMNGLLRGEIKIGMLQYDFGVYQYREIEEAPIQGVWLEEGVPVALVPVAIMKNAPHPNAGKLFLDWALSEDGQKVMLEVVGSYSARHGMPSPKGHLPMSEWKQLYVKDIDEYAAGLKDFANEWTPIIK